MRPGIQSFLLEVGLDGCYALTIAQLAEVVLNTNLDIVSILDQAVNKRFIKFNYNDYNDNDNMFVIAPAEMLSWLTGKKWTVSKEGPDYKAKDGELVVDRWERIKTGMTSGHFSLPNWDPFHNSLTVKYGKIVSKRVFRCAGK